MTPFSCLACEQPLVEKRIFSVPVSETMAATPLCRPCAIGLSVDELLSYVARIVESWPPEAPRQDNGPPGRLETARLWIENWALGHNLDEDPVDFRDREILKAKPRRK